MTDKQFQKILDTLAMARNNYLELLAIAEKEIVKRHGAHPSEVDNDQWIDSYHVGCRRMTVKEVAESMKFHGS